jgi:hypothetical protein
MWTLPHGGKLTQGMGLRGLPVCPLLWAVTSWLSSLSVVATTNHYKFAGFFFFPFLKKSWKKSCITKLNVVTILSA